jgi:hypothetical protein
MIEGFSTIEFDLLTTIAGNRICSSLLERTVDAGIMAAGLSPRASLLGVPLRCG